MDIIIYDYHNILPGFTINSRAKLAPNYNKHEVSISDKATNYVTIVIYYYHHI